MSPLLWVNESVAVRVLPAGTPIEYQSTSVLLTIRLLKLPALVARAAAQLSLFSARSSLPAASRLEMLG